MMESDMNNKRRFYIVKEIIETEREYVNKLQIILTYWKKPMIEQDLLPQAMIRAIFSIIDGILCLHVNFLKELEDRFSNWNSDSTLIGDIFKKNVPALKLYTEYVNRYNTAMKALIQGLDNYPKFYNFAQEKSGNTSNAGLALQSLLIQPIQRIPRYTLLVQDLLQHTHLSHSDYTNLSYTHKKLLEIADFINGQKKTYDQIDKMFTGSNPNHPVKLAPRLYLSKTESGRVKVIRKTYSQSQRKTSRIEISPHQPEVLQVIQENTPEENSQENSTESYFMKNTGPGWVVVGLFVIFIGSVLYYNHGKVKL